MKRLLIGALVGALILFFWQFLSYGFWDLHYSKMSHTPAQEEIMNVLQENLTDGEYYMMRAPQENPELQQQMMQNQIGKPWAIVQYHSELKHTFGMNMLRGFIIDFMAVLIFCWILSNFKEVNMKNALLSSIGIGFIGYLVVNYLEAIWFEVGTLPDLIDAIVPWAGIGAWLGYWMKRN